MAYTYSEALEQLDILLRDGNVTVAALEKLVADTSDRVPQAGRTIYLNRANRFSLKRERCLR